MLFIENVQLLTINLNHPSECFKKGPEHGKEELKNLRTLQPRVFIEKTQSCVNEHQLYCSLVLPN